MNDEQMVAHERGMALHMGMFAQLLQQTLYDMKGIGNDLCPDCEYEDGRVVEQCDGCADLESAEAMEGE